MFVLESYSAAVAFCVITMLCWGSWANTQKLAGRRWRFELFYWDYVFGVLMMALIFAFTMGSSGEGGRPFLEDLRQADSASIGSAIAGGAIFNAANILLVAAIAVAGMSVAFPVGIGLALVIGVLVNYMAQDTAHENPILLFIGVGLIAVAIVLNALAYRRLPAQKRGGVIKGLALAVTCGVLMGFFYRFVAASMPTETTYESFRNLPAGKLGPYAAMVLFSLGILASQIVFNFAVIVGWSTTEGTKIPAYFLGSPLDHIWGIVGGMIWAVGMMLSIVAMGVAGPAVAYGLGQGATLIAAFWGVCIWREFREAPQGTGKLIGLMFGGYVVGLTLIILAKVFVTT